MKIGILSDTHGNVEAAADASRSLREAGVDAVFHCGDIGGMEVLTELAAVFEPLGVPIHAVLGNVDSYSADYRFFPSNVGVHLHGRFADVRLGEMRIAMIHSDDLRRYNQTVFAGEYDLVLSGHSHAVHDYKQDKARCVNPGSAGRGSPNTCAVLDVVSGELIVIEL